MRKVQSTLRKHSKLFLAIINKGFDDTLNIDVGAPALHGGGVAMGGVAHGVEVLEQGVARTSCGSNELWLEQVRPSC